MSVTRSRYQAVTADAISMASTTALFFTSRTTAFMPTLALTVAAPDPERRLGGAWRAAGIADSLFPTRMPSLRACLSALKPRIEPVFRFSARRPASPSPRRQAAVRCERVGGRGAFESVRQTPSVGHDARCFAGALSPRDPARPDRRAACLPPATNCTSIEGPSRHLARDRDEMIAVSASLISEHGPRHLPCWAWRGSGIGAPCRSRWCHAAPSLAWAWLRSAMEDLRDIGLQTARRRSELRSHGARNRNGVPPFYPVARRRGDLRLAGEDRCLS